MKKGLSEDKMNNGKAKKVQDKSLFSIIVRTIFSSVVTVLSAAGLITLAVPTLRMELYLVIKEALDYSFH